MRYSISELVDKNLPEIKKEIIFDEVTSDSVSEIIKVIEEENPGKITIVGEVLTGNSLKNFLDAVKSSHIKWLRLEGQWWFYDDDFSILLKAEVLDKILYPMNFIFINLNLDFLVISEERVNRLLAVEENLLKSINPAKQSFSPSCSAYSIMNVMYHDTPDFNLYNELAIYKKIWEEPGGVADPVKIKEFLESNGYQVELVISKSLTKQISEHNEIMKEKLTLLKKHFREDEISERGIDFSTFRGDHLFFTWLPGEGIHTISGRREPAPVSDNMSDDRYDHKEDLVCIEDTDHRKKYYYERLSYFEKIYNKSAKPKNLADPNKIHFTGVSFNLRKKPK